MGWLPASEHCIILDYVTRTRARHLPQPLRCFALVAIQTNIVRYGKTQQLPVSGFLDPQRGLDQFASLYYSGPTQNFSVKIQIGDSHIQIPGSGS